MHRLTSRDLKGAGVVIQPKPGAVPFGDLEHKQLPIKTGRDAADAAIPAIKHLAENPQYR